MEPERASPPRSGGASDARPQGRAARPEHVSVKANGAQGRAEGKAEGRAGAVPAPEGKERSDAQAACRRSPHAIAWACSSRTRSITG